MELVAELVVEAPEEEPAPVAAAPPAVAEAQ